MNTWTLLMDGRTLARQSDARGAELAASWARRPRPASGPTDLSPGPEGCEHGRRGLPQRRLDLRRA